MCSFIDSDNNLDNRLFKWCVFAQALYSLMASGMNDFLNAAGLNESVADLKTQNINISVPQFTE